MPRGETNVRLPIGIIMLAGLAGCGEEQAAPPVQAPPGMASEITVELPPPAERRTVEVEGPDGTTATYRLQASEPDDIIAAWAAVLRDNGFACARIVSARQLAREDGSAVGVYRIECSDGGTYQGTRRDGRVRFRRWTGRL